VKRPIHQANARQEQSTNHDGEDSASVDRFVTNVFNSAFPCPATASNRADLNACIHITPDEFQIQSVQVISNSNSETCVSDSSFLGVCADTLRCVFNFVSTLLVGLSPVKIFSVLMCLGAFFLCLAGADGTKLFPNFRQSVSCLSPSNSARHPPVIVTLQVENVALPMGYDSGAAVTLIPLCSFQSNFGLKFKPTNLVLQGVSGPIKTEGEVVVKVFCPDSRIGASLPLIICDSIQLKHPLLGRNWLDVLCPSWRKSVCTASLLNQSSQETDHVSLFTTRFPKVFSSDSSSATVGFSVKLSLKPNAIPKFCSPYSLPFALQDIMSAMLTKLEQEGKLIKVDRSEWASPIFLVPKKKMVNTVCVWT